MARTIKYEFSFEGGKAWEYELNFDERNVLIPLPSTEVKAWTKLSFCQCPHCPLPGSQYSQCPIARNIDRVVEDSKAAMSIDAATVSVVTPERTYTKKCSTQVGLFALFGLIMASSGCPHLDWLRPLARFHLPFATTDETLFRVLSLQLLTEFFAKKKLGTDVSVDTIIGNYEVVEKVNHSFKKRITDYCKGDADKNALAGLDIFVQLFDLQQQSDFSALRKYF